MRWLNVMTLVLAAYENTKPQQSRPPAANGASLTWKTLAAAPLSRTGVAATDLDGKIYVAGGYRAGGSTAGTVDIFDTRTSAGTAARSASAGQPRDGGDGLRFRSRVWRI